MFLKLKKKKGNILQRMILPISWVRKMRHNPVMLDPYSREGWTRGSTLQNRRPLES